MPTALPNRVNVQDFGAVPDGRTDCTAAFQRAVDALDADPFLGGGTVFVPAAPNVVNDDGTESVGMYLLSRSVLVDKGRVRIVGEDPLRSVVETTSYAPAFTFGLRPGTRTQAMSPDHWVDLHGILDDTAFAQGVARYGYRTSAAASTGRHAEQYTVTFPATPFAFGPPDGTYWGGVRRFTLDFVVRNNTGRWQDHQQLFGLVDSVGNAAPWYAQVRERSSGAVVVQLTLRTTDGLNRDIMVPIAPDRPVLRCSIQLDLDSGAVAAWVDRVQVAVDLSLVNDGWPTGSGGTGPTLVPNWYSPFNLGSLTPSSVGMTPAGVINADLNLDVTFAALRLSNVSRYQDLGIGTAQRTTAGAAVTDADWVTGSAGEFARLPVNENVSVDAAGHPTDMQVPWDAHDNGNGFGVFVATDLGVDAFGTNGIERLTVNCGRRFAAPGRDNYGQAVAVGLQYDFSLRDVTVQYGAQGLGTYNIGSNYPIEVHDCVFERQSDAALYGYMQILHAGNLKFADYGRSALKAVRSGVSARDVFCTGSDTCVSAVRLYETTAQFDNWVFDFEGAQQVRDSFFWADVADAFGGPTTLVIRDCQGGAATPGTAAVRLVSADRNGGLPTSLRRDGWCTIERSFTNYLPTTAQALVAVDGPMWQGQYTGLPPAQPPLVITTAAPGASARIGLGTVPAARTVPAPAGGDPIPDLPGLIGYYRVDRLTGLATGDPVPKLTDLSPAGNHGTAVGTPPVFQADAVNGLPAVRFTGGWYGFPTTPTTTGEATIFLVTRQGPLFTTGTMVASIWYWAVATTLANGVTALTANSDTDWVVYAARYAKGSGRILTTWANGHRSDSRRFAAAADASWTAPTLGTIDAGKTPTSGMFSAGVFCAAALTDAQVDQVGRYLLNHHQIPV